MTPYQLLAQAQQALHSGQAAEAQRLGRLCLDADPRQHGALNLLGIIHLQRGERAPAVDCLERSIAIEPRQPRALINLGNAQRDLGRTAEALACFELAATLEPTLPEAHLYRGNVLADLERFAEARAAYERALALRPGDVRILDNLGTVCRRLGELDRAVSLHRQAVQLRSDSAESYNHLATALSEQERHAEAMPCFQRALALRPAFPAACYQLGLSLASQEQLAGAIRCFDEALRLKPDWALPWLSRGTAQALLGRYDESLASYGQALHHAPGWAEARYNKGTALLALGDYAEGWALYEARLESGLLPGGTAHKRWDGGELAGKRLLIRSEQGLGDVLQFVRYAALCKARGATVIVACFPLLHRLLRNCPFIDEVVTELTEEHFDLQIEMMSLPRHFGTRLDGIPAEIPYLRVDDAARARWAPRFAADGVPRVGLVWAGNPREHHAAGRRIDARRSMGLEQMLPLLEQPGIRFYSLQFGARAADLERLGLRGRVADHMGEVQDYLDTAAIIEQLDLVISVDTSVVHAAGALGKPVWVLSRFDACWRWLRNQAQSPWYPSARVFGQPAPGDWDAVIGQVREALAREFRPG